MLLPLGPGRNPHCIALIGLGKGRNFAGHGRRKHHRAAGGGGRAQNIFQILAEPQIQHLVRFVQNSDAQAAQVQRIAHHMVLKPPRRADHDMRAPVQIAPLGPHIHAADATGKRGPGRGIKPFQFAVHLQGQFARRRNDQCQGGSGGPKPVDPIQQPLRHGQPERHRLARAGLRRHQHIRPVQCRVQTGLLHRGQCGIAFGGKGLRKGGGDEV